MDIAQLNKWICEGSPSAMEVLSRLEDLCVHDETSLTPLNAAIRCGNKAVFDVLVENPAALDYVPEPDEKDRQVLKHIAASMDGSSVQEVEAAVAKTFGEDPNERYWMRTPLLEACRHDNREAMTALVVHGAALDDKDILGFDALRMCLDVGGLDQLKVLLDASIAQGRGFPVDDGLLERCLDNKEVYDSLVSHGTLSTKAKRLVFNLACARLDMDGVRDMLAAGHDATKSVYHGRTPLAEAATSQLAWALGDKESESLTRSFEREHGSDAGKSSNIDLQGIIDDIQAWMAEEGDLEDEPDLDFSAESVPEINPKFQPTEIVERRLAMMDLLRELGFDPQSVKGGADQDLLSDLACSNEPRLLQKLIELGARFEIDSYDYSLALAIQKGCYDMVEPIVAVGMPMPEVEEHWRAAYEQYLQWCDEQGRTAAEPGTAVAPDMPGVRFRDPYLAIRESEAIWDLGGESTLLAALLPDPPEANGEARVRLTHFNIYWPVDDVAFFVRLGDPRSAKPLDRPEAAVDWVPAVLVEELVDVDDETMLRAEAGELAGETPWDGTFEAKLTFPAGTHLVEIKVVAPDDHFVPAGVIADWVVDVPA